MLIPQPPMGRNAVVCRHDRRRNMRMLFLRPGFCTVVGSVRESSGVGCLLLGGRGWGSMVIWTWRGCQKSRWELWYGHYLGDCWL